MNVEKIQKELQNLKERRVDYIVEVLISALYDEKYVDVFLDLKNFNLIYKEVEPQQMVELNDNSFKILHFNPKDFDRLSGETQVRVEIKRFVEGELNRNINIFELNKGDFLTAADWR